MAAAKKTAKKRTAKGKGGRPPYKPNDEHRRQVEQLTGFGMPIRAMGKVLKISENTIRKHYADELETGRDKANANVAKSLYRKATGDGAASVTAAIFWLKAQAGWKEPVHHEHKGNVTLTSVLREIDGTTRGLPSETGS